MNKQALGITTSNFNKRYDTSSHILLNPQTPIVYTRTSELLGFNDMPSGNNIIVGICNLSYNQEDAIIINRSSIERGLFNSMVYKTHTVEVDKKLSNNFKEKICVPNKELCSYLKYGNYDKLDEYGIVKKDHYITDHDVIVGKITPLNKTEKKGEINYKDTSVLLKHNDKGIVDSTIKTYNSNGFDICKIKIRDYKTPKIGDKFASRSAQKGVIGKVMEEKDMPYTENGMTPDIIINTHSLPS